jgi:uracil-DNA glycosylase
MEMTIEESWKNVLAPEFEKKYFKDLTQFVTTQYQKGAVFPAQKDIFHAFATCPYDRVRVVILGQDPYHGPGQATGLSFAVPAGVRVPPSLQNIFKEIAKDTGITPDTSNGNLERWTAQGVLLLNSTLTVAANAPGSHQKKGWEEFTDAVIHALSEKEESIVFILWGNYARAKGASIDRSKHLVLESPHPSPFSAHAGFFGSKPFSATNEHLVLHGFSPIDWR